MVNGKDSMIDVSQARAREEMQARSEENAKDALKSAAEGQAAGPQVIARIVIEVMSDGNLSVDAPFENQLLVRGALSAAEDVVRMMGAQIVKQRREQGLQVVRKGEPWYARLARQARGG